MWWKFGLTIGLEGRSGSRNTPDRSMADSSRSGQHAAPQDAGRWTLGAGRTAEDSSTMTVAIMKHRTQNALVSLPVSPAFQRVKSGRGIKLRVAAT